MSVPHRPADRDRAVAALSAATGQLSTLATARMEADLTWFAQLGAQDKSWVNVIVQAGVRGFVDWYAAAPGTLGHSVSGGAGGRSGSALAAEVFGAAPRALTGVINLKQTVDLVRLTIEAVEVSLPEVLDPQDLAEVHSGVLRYAREVAFATAEVYARAAETRGAWDARLEALVVDAVLRAETDETLLSRASALGWAGRTGVVVVIGTVPPGRDHAGLFEEIRRSASLAHLDALCATQGDRLVVLLGGVHEAVTAAASVLPHYAPGPVVVGPPTETLREAHASARAALSAQRAAPGWPEAPRPVRSEDLLPERALSGDGHARRHLVDSVHRPLLANRSSLVETLSTYFEAGSSTEAAARALFVHPNTVRYRLRQVTELTGLVPGDARDSFTLRIALVLGRLYSPTPAPTPSPDTAPGDPDAEPSAT